MTGVKFLAGAVMEFFFSTARLDRFWNPPSLLSSGYRRFLPRG